MSSLSLDFFRSFLILLPTVAFATTLQAQQGLPPERPQPGVYVVGTTANLVSGGSNTPSSLGVGSAAAARQFAFFYAAYPSLRIDSAGEHSTFGASYNFGWNHVYNQQNMSVASHQASLNYSRTLLKRWKINLAGSFQMTSDAATFNALQGIAPVSQDFNYLVSTTAVSEVMRNGATSFLTDYTIDDKSTLSATVSYNFLNYANTGISSASLVNQQRVSGGMTYSRKTSTHETWSLGYSGAVSVFKGFGDVSTQTVHVGYSDTIRPNLVFALSVGASQVENLESGASTVGANTSVSLQKNIPEKDGKIYSFTLHYSQDTGSPTGLGTVSNTRTGGVGLNRSGRTASMFRGCFCLQFHWNAWQYLRNERRDGDGECRSSPHTQAVASMGRRVSAEQPICPSWIHTKTFVYVVKILRCEFLEVLSLTVRRAWLGGIW